MKSQQQFDAERIGLVRQLREQGIHDQRVLEAFLSVPREHFAPEDVRERAYENSALSIGSGQTISQPLMVAIMLQAVAPASGSRVLEVGAGSGYLLALLSKMGCQVLGLERLPELAAVAANTLTDLGISNFKIRVTDGSDGYAAFAPYDAIIVSCSAPRVPEALLEQLVIGGRMAVPVGDRTSQRLLLITRIGDSDYQTAEHGGCVFVPLVGRHGWPDPEQQELPVEPEA